MTFPGSPAGRWPMLPCQLRLPPRPPPTTPTRPADLGDGAGHLAEVLVSAGHVPPGVVADAGLWAPLGGRVPSRAQQQRQREQQEHGDARAPGARGRRLWFTGAGDPHASLAQPWPPSRVPRPQGKCHRPEPRPLPPVGWAQASEQPFLIPGLGPRSASRISVHCFATLRFSVSSGS